MSNVFDRLLPGERPSYDDLVETVRQLTEKHAEISVQDLPMASLQASLEQTWQPNASTLLQPGAITPELLSANEAPRFIGAAGQPAFTGTWANLDVGSPPPLGTARNAAFWKDRDGMVWLSGLITAGASGTSAFTLPAGYRPSSLSKALTVLASGGPAQLVVASSGTVTPTNIGASAVAAFCFLDDCCFRAGS